MDGISEVKDKINIVDYIGGYVQLKRTGKNFKGLCPFHKEKSPSFIVTEELQRYKCFGCGKSGDIFNFVMDYEGLEFGEALKLLAEKAGVELKVDPQFKLAKSSTDNIERVNNLAATFYHNLLMNHDYGKISRAYLKKRNLTPEIIREFKLGYSPNSWDSLSKTLIKREYKPDDLVKAGLARYKKNGTEVYDVFRTRLIFPLVDYLGKTVGFAGRSLLEGQIPKYLNTQETPLYHKEKFLYGLHLSKKHIHEKDAAIIVEGYFDMISLYQHGFKNVVASSGTALTSGQLGLIKRLSTNIILVFDGDAAGVQAAIRGIDVVQNAGLNLKIVTLPSDVKDPDELMQKEPMRFHECLDRALPVWDFYFSYVSKTYKFDDVYEKKRASDFLLGIISQISDEVLKNQYIKKFATMFEVSEEAAVAQLNKTPDKVVTRFERQESERAEGKTTEKAVLSPDLYLMYLLFHSPAGDIYENISRVEPEYLGQEELKELYKAFEEHLSSGQESVDIKAFYDKLPEYNPDIHKMFERIYLVDISTNLEDHSVFESEFRITLRRVQFNYLNRKIKEKSKELKMAENSKNLDLSKNLQDEINIYISKLKELKA